MEITRHDGHHLLTLEQWLPVPRDELFPFFADAFNLERITPETLQFEVLTPAPIEMKPGALIDYRLTLRCLPIRWRTEIADWEPPRRFVDRQVRGPYELWHHEHTFEERDGGTRCLDRVEYRVPGGPLAPLIHSLFIRREVERIFRYRQKTLEDLFGQSA